MGVLKTAEAIQAVKDFDQADLGDPLVQRRICDYFVATHDSNSQDMLPFQFWIQGGEALDVFHCVCSKCCLAWEKMAINSSCPSILIEKAISFRPFKNIWKNTAMTIFLAESTGVSGILDISIRTSAFYYMRIASAKESDIPDVISDYADAMRDATRSIYDEIGILSAIDPGKASRWLGRVLLKTLPRNELVQRFEAGFKDPRLLLGIDGYNELVYMRSDRTSKNADSTACCIRCLADAVEDSGFTAALEFAIRARRESEGDGFDVEDLERTLLGLSRKWIPSVRHFVKFGMVKEDELCPRKIKRLEVDANGHLSAIWKPRRHWRRVWMHRYRIFRS